MEQQEQRGEQGAPVPCPMCGGTGQVPRRRMRMKAMMPLGMAFVSVVPALVGFTAGFLVGSTRRQG